MSKVNPSDMEIICVNCGNNFKNGEGFPKGKYECCCSEECWYEFNDVELGNVLVYVDFE
ncbi:MAG: hypothetical protein ACOY9Y_10890 [Bacillota bacterium]